MQNHENGSNQVMSNNDRPIPSLATKRTPGPFMDVIHPSSNMMKDPNQSTRINGSVVNPILSTQNNEIAKSETHKRRTGLLIIKKQRPKLYQVMTRI